MAPPNTLAPAAVSPSSTLVKMGDMREKNSRKQWPVVSVCHQQSCFVTLTTPRVLHPNVAFFCDVRVGFHGSNRPPHCYDFVTEAHVSLLATRRMAGLRRVFDHPCLLVHDSSVCRTVACAASLAVCPAGAAVDGDVGYGCTGDSALAGHLALSSRLGMGRCGPAICLRTISIFAIRKEFQREAARRAARNSWRESRAAAGDGRNPVAGTASGVPGASVRNAGMEHRDRPGGLLGSDGVCHGHRGSDDPDGGFGTGNEVWRLLPRVSQIRARRSAASGESAPAIIRCN